jgi:transposase
MSPYRFKTNFNRSVKTEASRGPRVEVITGVERRRDWSDEEKLSIIMESCRDGVVISDVARRHGLKPQQLFTWRNEFRRQQAARVQQNGAPAFAPVMIAHERPAAAPISGTVAALIEITIGGATVRVSGGVDAKALAAVLRAVKAAT